MKQYLVSFYLYILFCLFNLPCWSQSIKADNFNIKDSSSIKKEVLDHIDKIFKAFVEKDTITIRNLHAGDWLGILQFSDIKRGINEYMQPLRGNKPSMTWYHIDDCEVQIFQNVVLAYYIATIRNNFQGNEVESRLKSVDVYQKRNGAWAQVGSHIASRISFSDFIQMMQNKQNTKSN
jgi:hypothetical protein